MSTPTPTPFTIAVPQETLDRITAQVRAFRWHEMPAIAPGADRWAYGSDMEYMRELCAYWTDTYDWRAAETALNRFDHFRAGVEDQTIHYILERGSGANPPALILTHGWPGSVFEFTGVIERLAHPERFGGKADDGVSVVAPSLPGYGFSGKPETPVGPKRTAALWDALMRKVLGFETYVAQGGDWGAVVSARLGYDHAPTHGGGCGAVHINMFGMRSPDARPQTDEEKAWAQNAGLTMELEGAYMRLQMTKPQTLSYAMMDSPVGAAAWIVEKFNSWSDTRNAADPDAPKHIENAYTKDQLLTNIMIYLATDTFNTATWFYRGMFEEGGVDMASGRRVEVPVGIACYPHEFIPFPPRRMVEAGYNVARWSMFERGGHFAALETGPAFADDVLAFVAQVKDQL